MAQRPDLAVEGGQARDVLAFHRQDHVAGFQFGARRRTLGRDADGDDLVLDLGRIEPEPRPRRLVDAAEFAQVIKDRRQQVDRHHHVEMLVLALARAFELQGADPDQLALRRNQRGATPVGMRRRGEDRLVEHVFPIAREFLLGGDAAGERTGAAAGAADHHALALAARRTIARALDLLGVSAPEQM